MTGGYNAQMPNACFGAVRAAGMHAVDRFRRIHHRRGRALRHFALAVVGLLWAGSAIAAPPLRVLVLPGGSDEAAAASLAEALRIQLGAQGKVSVGDALMGSNLSAKVHEATVALDRMDASLALWVEPSSQEAEILLFAVLREGGRTLVATLHAPPEDRAAIERMLAVKVVEILRGPLMAPAPPPPPPAPPRPLPCPAPAVPTLPARHHTWLASLGLWGALPTAGTGIREGLLGELGWRLATPAWAVEPFAAGRLVSTAVIDDSGAQLTVGETDFAIGARVLRVWARFSLGAGVQAEGWLLRADTSGPNAPGKSWHMVPALSGKFDARVRIGAGVEARIAAGAAFPLRDTTFVVGGREFLDYGHVRPMADLSLVFSPR
jgi:hypothetical protein